MEKLTTQMQARLDKWRKSLIPIKNSEKIRGPSPSKFRPVGRDHGDDMSDFEGLKNQIMEGK